MVNLSGIWYFTVANRAIPSLYKKILKGLVPAIRT